MLDDPVRLGAADVARVLLDVDEEADVGLRPGEGGRVNADHDDALVVGVLDDLLQARRVGVGHDTVSLERDRLIEALLPADRRAVAVDDDHLPADLGAGFGYRLPPLARGIVLLVGRHVDDQLARVGLRR